MFLLIILDRYHFIIIYFLCRKCIDNSQENVEGTVKLAIFKGHVNEFIYLLYNYIIFVLDILYYVKPKHSFVQIILK